MHWLERKIIPPFQVLILGTVEWWLHRSIGFLHYHFGFEYLLSRILLVIALVLVVASIYPFWRHKTTVNPVKLGDTSSLITTGMFGFSRNPIYVADALVLVAWTVYLGFWGGLILVPVFIAYITRFQIMPEERVLAEKFGAQYSAYCAGVRRWL